MQLTTTATCFARRPIIRRTCSPRRPSVSAAPRTSKSARRARLGASPSWVKRRAGSHWCVRTNARGRDVEADAALADSPTYRQEPLARGIAALICCFRFRLCLSAVLCCRISHNDHNLLDSRFRLVASAIGLMPTKRQTAPSKPFPRIPRTTCVAVVRFGCRGQTGCQQQPSCTDPLRFDLGVGRARLPCLLETQHDGVVSSPGSATCPSTTSLILPSSASS